MIFDHDSAERVLEDRPPRLVEAIAFELIALIASRLAGPRGARVGQHRERHLGTQRQHVVAERILKTGAAANPVL